MRMNLWSYPRRRRRWRRGIISIRRLSIRRFRGGCFVAVVLEDSFLFSFIRNKLKLMIRMVMTPKGFREGTVTGLGIECGGVDVE